MSGVTKTTATCFIVQLSVVVLAGLRIAASTDLSQIRGFIKVYNTTGFVDATTCEIYIPLGWNSWVSLNEEASRVAQNAPKLPAALNQDNKVTQLLDKAKQNGWNTVRVFAHGQSEGYQLQTAPGVYDEYVFQGLDYLLAAAAARGIRATLVLVNNWLAPTIGDGKQRYVTWAGIPLEDEDVFWNDTRTKGLVKDHYTVMANRRNVFSGLVYRDDPAIFSWDLYNEPRCPASQLGGGCPGPVTSFMNEMAAHLKSIDPNHLVTIGEEGFFEVNSGQKDADPFGIPSNVAPSGRYWAAEVGQDFFSQHASPNIDYAAFHIPKLCSVFGRQRVAFWSIWSIEEIVRDVFSRQSPTSGPASQNCANYQAKARAISDNQSQSQEGHRMWPNNWNTTDLSFPPIWIQGHIDAARRLGKPLVLEEFGKTGSPEEKLPYFDIVYKYLEESLASGDSPFTGAMFWRWENNNGETDSNTVYNDDAVSRLIYQYVSRINALYQGRLVPNCISATFTAGFGAAPALAPSTLTAASPFTAPDILSTLNTTSSMFSGVSNAG